MSHIPTPADMATDLLRCVYSSVRMNNLTNNTSQVFWKNAMSIYPSIRSQISKESLRDIDGCLARAQDVKNSIKKRQEDLLTASVLLR